MATFTNKSKNSTSYRNKDKTNVALTWGEDTGTWGEEERRWGDLVETSYTNKSKNSASFTNKTKNSASLTNKSKNSASFTNKTKN